MKGRSSCEMPLTLFVSVRALRRRTSVRRRSSPTYPEPVQVPERVLDPARTLWPSTRSFLTEREACFATPASMLRDGSLVPRPPSSRYHFQPRWSPGPRPKTSGASPSGDRANHESVDRIANQQSARRATSTSGPRSASMPHLVVRRDRAERLDIRDRLTETAAEYVLRSPKKRCVRGIQWGPLDPLATEGLGRACRAIPHSPAMALRGRALVPLSRTGAKALHLERPMVARM